MKNCLELTKDLSACQKRVLKKSLNIQKLMGDEYLANNE